MCEAQHPSSYRECTCVKLKQQWRKQHPGSQILTGRSIPCKFSTSGKTHAAAATATVAPAAKTETPALKDQIGIEPEPVESKAALIDTWPSSKPECSIEWRS
jgi:hypothetical protein